MNISGSANKGILDNRVVNNNGSATWSGTGLFFNGGGAVFNNNGIFNAQSDTGWFGGIFNNVGTFIKTGSTTTSETTIGSVFNNSGTVEIRSGRLDLEGGGNHTGSFSVASGSVLRFDGGTHNLQSGSSVTGTGEVFNFFSTVNVNGTYNLNGITRIDGAGVTNFNSNATTASLLLFGGVLGGSGTLNVSGLGRRGYGWKWHH